MACEIVAELSNNHNGDRDRLGRLIDAAQAAGADAVKFQCYTPDELVALRGNGPAPQPWGGMGYSMRALYEKAQTPLEWFPKIAAHCERVGIPWFSSVFGKDSLACLEAVGCPRYKISHFEYANGDLVGMAFKTGKPVIVSYPTPVPINEGCYCPGGYPARLDEMHLAGEGAYYYWGLSSHCTHPLVAPLAVARKVQYLEFHMMLRDEPSELESNVSMDEHQFSAMVQSVRDAEVLLG